MANREESSKLARVLSNAVGYGTVAATIAILFFFLVWPVAVIVSKAFINDGQFTLEYFPLLFANELFKNSMVNSLWIGVATTVLTTIVSLPLAIINAKYEFRGKALLSGLLLVPMVMPPFVGAIGIQRFFARRGSVNIALMEWGIIDTPIDWLGPENMFWAVVVLEVLHLYPIMYLNLTAALANIDPSVEEMATTLGVPRWRQYLDIIWPLARPGYFAGAIIVFIWALTDLGTPLLVGFHETIPVQIFNMITDVNENPIGYSLVFIVIAMTVGFFLISKFALGNQKYEMMAKGHVTSGKRQASGLGLVFIYALVLGTVIAALIPHISVVITSLSDKWFMTVLPENYTLKYYAQIFEAELPYISIKNSLFFAGLSTIVDLVLGLLIAYVIVRKLVPFPSLLDSLVMVPLALPGIVLAFGYVVTYSDTALDPLNNPIPLLVIAYAIRRLPYMVRSAVAGLQQTSISLEEASETFGASRFHTMRKITIPLVMANLIAGALLCFSYAMLDVSDSLILAMKEKFYPLTKAIYVLFLEQGSGELVASALGMVGMLILTVCIMGSSLILGKKMGELFRS
ncbi:ABC transporter permease [Pseudobacteriovorax antillogorgiicola]|uniref:Iron(III) transport system permease protein n=1 Tax=Pseudobacteriovorax antillogorgiicola TaxID=1513793 RepID=A0A1Y6CMM1_9BACT|nr:iron ABC transporter permease [Pseudobacteriovorax antillogorgiicola]TCS45006.1 iron(III) transport system permease protein [Pseudobacteriovorax antillogorgiicola]SMF76452.1 iron(III) transport system permease protein [Pseudobacteriovorax antillogorgiicola]